MSFRPVVFFLSLVLLNFASSSSGKPLPNPSHPPSETVGLHRRGVAFNEAKYVKYFDIGGSQITWVSHLLTIHCRVLTTLQAYNWDSRPNGNTGTWHEFVPMLHSVRADHTGKWAADVIAAANGNKDMPTHLLGFNEPDNCE
jgi:hypothetical protein